MDLEELARDIRAHNVEVKTRFDEQKAAFDRLDPAVAELKAQVTEVEQKMARRGAGGGHVETKSWGQQFTESDQLKGFIAGGASGKLRMELKATNTITTAGTSGAAAGGSLVAPDRQGPIILPRRTFTVRDLLAPGITTSNVIQVPVMTSHQLNAAPVPETGMKPQSDMNFVLTNFPVATIAHFVVASKQIMDDAPVMAATIDGELRYGLAYNEDIQLLMGDGSGANLLGMIPQAVAYSAAFAVTGETMMDRLRLAMLQVRLALYPSTGIIFNPTDWAKLQLIKDSMGRYIFGDPHDTGMAQLWGVPIAESDSMPAGQFLTGAFGLACQIFDRQEATVEISTEDNRNFVTNQLTVRAEERLALVTRRPQALVYGTLP